MFKAILFDLDDTLLRNEVNGFVGAYFKTLLPKIGHFFPDGNAPEVIQVATNAMMAAERDERTLRDVFIETFDEHSPVPFAEVEPVFLDYYQNEFQAVESVTHKVPLANQALQAANALTDKIALATIPIFPKIAIEERLRWAGIAEFPFKLITAFENMHTSKPNPDYYLEIADHLETAPEDCLMIGNCHRDDMIAKQVGMQTYLVTDFELHVEHKKVEPDYRGSMQNLVDFLKNCKK